MKRQDHRKAPLDSRARARKPSWNVPPQLTALALVAWVALAGGCRDRDRDAPPQSEKVQASENAAAMPSAPENTAAAAQAQAAAAASAQAAADDLDARIETALLRGASYLVSRQAADGAFRSTEDEALSNGYSLTPPVVLALWGATRGGQGATATASVADKARARGAGFLATIITPEGVIRTGDDAPRFPYHAAAGALLVLSMHGAPEHAEVRGALVAYLLGLQLTETHGYPSNHPSYGGWGYNTAIPEFEDGHAEVQVSANLAITEYIVGALRMSGVAADHPAMQKAEVFVSRCQNFTSLPEGEGAPGTPEVTTTDWDDGGFFQSRSGPDSNLAGVGGMDVLGRTRYRSYGSATADGLRTLLQLGFGGDDPRVAAATRWLLRNFSAVRNAGAFPPELEVRRAAYHYYYAHSVAHAMRAIGAAEIDIASAELVAAEQPPTDAETAAEEPAATRRVHWAEALAEALLARQDKDGAWRNQHIEAREDDPLVATPYALSALAIARMALTGESRTHRPDQVRL